MVTIRQILRQTLLITGEFLFESLGIPPLIAVPCSLILPLFHVLFQHQQCFLVPKFDYSIA